MNLKTKVENLWNDMDAQNWTNLKSYFHENAIINWHNTNEQFSPDEFVIVNSEYPGNWDIITERMEQFGTLVVSIVKVILEDSTVSFHATSFFEFENDKIKLLDEYWGDDGNAPQWRIDKQIGQPIYTDKNIS